MLRWAAAVFICPALIANYSKYRQLVPLPLQVLSQRQKNINMTEGIFFVFREAEG